MISVASGRNLPFPSFPKFGKEGLKPQLSNSPFEKRGIKGDFSATSAAAIGCIFLNELWFQDTRSRCNLAALAAGLTGWLLMKTTWFKWGLLVAAGLVLVYPSLLKDLIGLMLFALAAALQYLHRRSAAGRLSAAN